MLERFHRLSNNDSSVYLLTNEEDAGYDGILFGGDQLSEGWERLAKRMQLRCGVWKAPHHGMDDAFNAAMLRLIRPEVVVVPICSKRAGPLRTYWAGLNLEEPGQEVNLLITGDVAPGTSKLIMDGAILVYRLSRSGNFITVR